jgi:hypothetical protein
MIRYDAHIAEAISHIKLSRKEFDHEVIIHRLLDADLSGMLPMAIGFYLWSIWELSNKVFTKLEKLIEIHGLGEIFQKIPLEVTNVLGMHGGTGLALLRLIGEYAARDPIRAEAMTRLSNFL